MIPERGAREEARQWPCEKEATGEAALPGAGSPAPSFPRPRFLGQRMEGNWTSVHTDIGISGGVSAGVLWLNYPRSAGVTLLAYLEQPGTPPRDPEGLVSLTRAFASGLQFAIAGQ